MQRSPRQWATVAVSIVAITLAIVACTDSTETYASEACADTPNADTPNADTPSADTPSEGEAVKLDQNIETMVGDVEVTAVNIGPYEEDDGGTVVRGVTLWFDGAKTRVLHCEEVTIGGDRFVAEIGGEAVNLTAVEG